MLAGAGVGAGAVCAGTSALGSWNRPRVAAGCKSVAAACAWCTLLCILTSCVNVRCAGTCKVVNCINGLADRTASAAAAMGAGSW